LADRCVALSKKACTSIGCESIAYSIQLSTVNEGDLYTLISSYVIALICEGRQYAIIELDGKEWYHRGELMMVMMMPKPKPS
jgi:hypothetical protein